ncbi:MAG: pilus assembly protein TadG-related protein [Pseudomonadota bacterium]
MLKTAVKKFLRNTCGNVALTAAILSPAVLGTAALAFDYTYFQHHASKLQIAADAAVLTAAREMAIAGTTNAELREIAKSAAITSFYGADAAKTGPDGLSIAPKINRRQLDIEVELSFNWQPFFAHYLKTDILPIVSKAEANLTNQHSICTLALHQNSAKVFFMSGNSELDARDCAIHSNSGHRRGLQVKGESKIISNSICSAGGYRGKLESFTPQPVTDCPVLQDPLAGKAFPTYFGCDHDAMVIKKQTRRLYPGVYCNGLKIKNNATVYFEPGTYIFVDGDLDAASRSRLIGDGVSLYFAQNARMAVRNSVSMSLSAPKTGDMTGILLAASPTNDPKKKFDIQSQDARKFTGLIYTPNNLFTIGGDRDGDGECEEIVDSTEVMTRADNPKECETTLGSYSEWTAIIAKKIRVTSGVKLVLNADYESSSVPVPTNDGALGSQAKLVR